MTVESKLFDINKSEITQVIDDLYMVHIDNEAIDRRQIIVFDDETRLSKPGYTYEEIRRYRAPQDIGCGMFDVWGNKLYFTTKDNSSPIDNKRTYAWRYVSEEEKEIKEQELLRHISNMRLDDHIALRKDIDVILPLFYHTRFYNEARDIKRISMLHNQILFLLKVFAGKTSRGILEIGAYVGGSTVALARGVSDPRQRVATIEAGGSHPTHQLATLDILADLHKNLDRYGVADRVDVLAGVFPGDGIMEQVRRAYGRHGVGLLVVDADGAVLQCLDALEDLLAPGCLVVLDDYCEAGVKIKEQAVRDGVEALKERKKLLEVGVYGCGTWIGLWR